MQLLDASGPVDPIAALAAGFTGAIRYVSPEPSKNLTRDEAQLYVLHNFDVCTVFESNTTDALGGYNAGLANGELAARLTTQCGAPFGVVIYAAIDFDSKDHQTVVAQYLKGFSDSVRKYGFLPGAYGGVWTIRVAQMVGYKYFWQTEAWSYGVVLPGITLLQRAAAPHPVGGTPIDLDVVVNADYGGWLRRLKPPAPPAPKPAPAPAIVVPLTVQEEVVNRVLVSVPTGTDGKGDVVLDGGTGSEPGVTSRAPAIDSAKVVAVGAWGSDPAKDGAYWGHVVAWQDRDGHPLVTVTQGPVNGTAEVYLSVSA